MKASLLRPLTLTARLRAVHRVKPRLNTARSLVTRADATDQSGSGAFVRGQAQFSKFYPSEARDFTFSRHVMLAVDGTHASEDAARWVIQNVVRSGDLLHLIHVAVPESFGVYYLGAPGTEIAGSELDWERKDEFWASCIRRTERMLDGTVTHIIGEDADAGEEMTPFRPPIELDCILDQTWYASLDIRNAYLSTFDREPVGEVLLNKAKESNAEILVVIKHHKSWVQKIFSGSVSEYLIDKSEIPVLVFPAAMPASSEDLILGDEDDQSSEGAR